MIRKFKHLKTGIIGTNDSKIDYFLHFERGNEIFKANEYIFMDFIEDSNDWVEVKEDIVKPTNWFECKQIETWIGLIDDDELQGGRAKLIVFHQCGNHNDVLIDQLKTMILEIETNGENFSS